MPTTIYSARWFQVLVLLGCLAAAGMCIGVIADPPEDPRRLSPEQLVAISWFGLVFFLFRGAVEFTILFRPSRLILDPAGLAYSRLRGQKTWAWRDVGPFEIEGGGATLQVIRISVEGAAGSSTSSAGGLGHREVIPGVWQLRLPLVCAELNAARERWRE